MNAEGGGAAAEPPGREGPHAKEAGTGYAAPAPASGPRPSPASPSHQQQPPPPRTVHVASDAGGLRDTWREILSSRMGAAGVVILAALIITSAATIVAIPVETLQEWNNPKSWISYPKAAVPAWTNAVLPQKIPEHMMLDDPAVSERAVAVDGAAGTITATMHEFAVDYEYDDFPSDFIYSFSAEYRGSPLLEVSVDRPDGNTILLLSKALPHLAADRGDVEGRADHDGGGSPLVHSERIFSTDSTIRKNIAMQAPSIYEHDTSGASTEDVLFSDAADGSVLRGVYTFRVTVFSLEGFDMLESRLVVGGKAFGIMGTDELRRDLAIGLLWGTPLALFIGITVAVASVVAGLLYGVYAGYRGKKTDEAMMRFNDVIYALPALPFLIILSVTVSNSILLMVGFLAMFGWVGVAKVARSMSLQIKTRGYVDAAETMGQSRSKIITRHIVPQLLPYAFASIAISVPAAITTEAGLSFLGLGDPSFPTWGQILHDANTFGAAARGLWWWMVPPGVMIAITGLAFVFIGNALDSIVNPRLRRR